MDMESARKAVDEMCQEYGYDIRSPYRFQSILSTIDRKYDKRTYKCPYCKDTGIMSWIDPEEGLWYGRRCGKCRYWDEQRERARSAKE